MSQKQWGHGYNQGLKDAPKGTGAGVVVAIAAAAVAVGAGIGWLAKKAQGK